MLVQSQGEGGRVGYVPANYVEEVRRSLCMCDMKYLN